MSLAVATHVIIDNQTSGLLVAAGVIAAVVSAIAVSVAAFQSRNAAQASRDAAKYANEAWSLVARPTIRAGSSLGDAKRPTVLQLWNRSGWTARDVRVEIRYRDGGLPDVDTRERFDSSPLQDGSYEPPWEVTLSRIRPDVADIIEAVVITYADARDIARYEQRLDPMPGQMPIVGFGEDRRIR
jgi:hypothetical protein